MQIEQIIDELRDMRGDIKQLRTELERYKGFVGGVLWCVSAIAASVGFVWGVLTHG